MTKCRVASALLVVGAALGCGGRDDESTTPAGAAGEPAAEAGGAARQDGPTPGARPCDGYVAEAMRCAREGSAALGEPLPDDPDVLEGYLRDRCRGWLRGGVTKHDLARALDACASASCAREAGSWQRCIETDLGVATVEPEFGDPSTWARIAPRPIDPERPPCDLFVEWMVACTVEVVGEEAMTAEIDRTLRDGYRQLCEGWESSPQMSQALPSILRACADVGCGSSGVDLMMCLGQEFRNAASGAAGSVEPASPAEAAPEAAPEP